MALMGVSHFMVDFTCALLVANIAKTDIALALLLYNFCAFALQMPLGLIVEHRFTPYKVASVGMIMVVLSWALLGAPEVALIVAGVGNALFHLGGGISVMNKSSRSGPLGVFIAPGAMGIYLGAVLPQSWLMQAAVVTATLAVVTWRRHEVPTSPPITQTLPPPYTAVFCIFSVVVVRGFVGVVQAFPWKSEWMFLFVLAVVVGKAVGGYLSDMFGSFAVGTISLTLSAVCFIFPQSVTLGLLGMFSFQMTMPITLSAVAKMTSKGFGFGLLTFGLFVGSIPLLVGIPVDISLSILAVLSLLLFMIGMKKGQSHGI